MINTILTTKEFISRTCELTGFVFNLVNASHGHQILGIILFRFISELFWKLLWNASFTSKRFNEILWRAFIYAINSIFRYIKTTSIWTNAIICNKHGFIARFHTERTSEINWVILTIISCYILKTNSIFEVINVRNTILYTLTILIVKECWTNIYTKIIMIYLWIFTSFSAYNLIIYVLYWLTLLN